MKSWSILLPSAEYLLELRVEHAVGLGKWLSEYANDAWQLMVTAAPASGDTLKTKEVRGERGGGGEKEKKKEKERGGERGVD